MPQSDAQGIFISIRFVKLELLGNDSTLDMNVGVFMNCLLKKTLYSSLMQHNKFKPGEAWISSKMITSSQFPAFIGIPKGEFYEDSSVLRFVTSPMENSNLT
jgi:hypothetical protein